MLIFFLILIPFITNSKDYTEQFENISKELNETNKLLNELIDENENEEFKNENIEENEKIEEKNNKTNANIEKIKHNDEEVTNKENKAIDSLAVKNEIENKIQEEIQKKYDEALKQKANLSEVEKKGLKKDISSNEIKQSFNQDKLISALLNEKDNIEKTGKKIISTELDSQDNEINKRIQERKRKALEKNIIKKK